MHLWSEIISSSVVPVVIISACGLLCLTFYNRLAFIVTRLRSLQRERLAQYKEIFTALPEQKGEVHENKAHYFLEYLEKQTTEVLKRARFLRSCIFWLIISIFLLVITSLMIGISFWYPIFDIAVLLFFISGLGSLLWALSFALREILIALQPIAVESEFVQQLIEDELKKTL